MEDKAWNFKGLLSGITTAILILCPRGSSADETVSVETELVAEVRENVSPAAGREAYRFVPAKLLTQGQIVYYTLRITNPTAVFAREVTVVQPVPANTAYIADSASGPAAVVSYSVDGGQTFGPPKALQIEVEGVTQPAQAAQYTHIRWRLRNPLAPGATALARFCAVFR